MNPTSVYLFFFLLLTSKTPPFRSCAAVSPPQDLVRSSCVHARYPSLCLATLSSYNYSGNPRAQLTPKDLAEAALSISLARVLQLADYLKSLQVPAGGSTKRQALALRDCAQQISESVDDLRRTLKEVQHLRVETLEWQMSNSQTWVSAAMTNERACVVGLGFKGVDPDLSSQVKTRIAGVTRLTSNALYMITRLAPPPPSFT